MKRMKSKGGKYKAEMKALLETKKTFSLQRLMHDYKEIQNQTVPLFGVSAVPIKDTMYEWHGNIKASTKNAYNGAVLHFKFVFPKDYPISPPKIYLLNPDFTHPNVMPDKSICLDMLVKEKEDYKGWKSSYTILSILLQLQSFFFDVDVLYVNEKMIKEQIDRCNDFKCNECEHKGSTNPYPPFISKVEDNSLFKLTKEQYKKLKFDELCCYIRKTNFREAPLGLGISVSKVSRTGEIKGIEPCFDFVSFKSYTKERIRTGLNGKRFTHWFPLYFGENKEKFLRALTRAISMVCKGNAKSFSEDLILKCMPKFFNFVCLNILSEKVHNSSRAIHILIYLYRILLLLSETYPNLKKMCNENIDKFIKDEQNRIKDITPSLGDLLVMLSISDYKIEDLLPSYLSEHMDRQIFWILQEIEGFEKLINSSEIDDIRAKVCFKTGIVSEHLLLFYYFFLKKLIYKDCKDLDEFAKKLDSNYGNLTDEECDIHRKEINNILKIDNFNDFYKYMNLSPPNEKELNEKLKNAFQNSLKKGYHGKDEVRFVPKELEQSKIYLSKYPELSELEKDGKLLDANDNKWKELCEKFDIVQLFEYSKINEEITPLKIIRFQRENLDNELFFKVDVPVKEKDCVNEIITQKSYKKKNEDEVIIEKMNFRQLYIKLYFEDYIKFFPHICNFKELYQLIEKFKDDLIHFTFHIDVISNLKSDWNYVRVIISKLINLKYLELIFKNKVEIQLLKNMMKGFTNALKSNGSIEHLKIRINPSFSPYSTKDLNILTILDKLPNLKVLDLENVKLDKNASLRIRNHLYYYRKIVVLNVNGCGINDDMAKEIADGIMKAKSLEKLYIANNNMNKGLSSFLYNLAFQPSIKVIDISKNNSCDKIETANSLYKLLKMSQTIEYLICSDISSLNNSLKEDFFSSLGDSNSLCYLDLSSSGSFNNIKLLGNAISFNALKNGSLKYVDISFTSLNYSFLINLIQSIEVCESDHVSWYGFQLNTNIQKESHEYYKKSFNCNLETLILKGTNLKTFENINDIKNVNFINHFKTLLNKSKKLDTLILDFCIINKYFFDILTNALQDENQLKYLSLTHSNINGDTLKSFLHAFKDKDKKEINKNFHIEALNLSCNLLGYSGIEGLCEVLKTNKTIKYLNLYHNLFDVNGARRIGEILNENTTLEKLDIGYNRIRNEGFNSILEGIKKNKNIGLKYLGVKYNFLKNSSLESVLNELNSNTTIPLEEIEFKKNQFTDEFINKFFKEKYNSYKKKIKLDIFEILYYLIPERLERTVWMSVGDVEKSIIYNELLKKEKEIIKTKDSHLGIPLYIRKVRGRKVGKKKNPTPQNAFVEFILPNSVNRMLNVAGLSNFMINNKRVRCFKGGSKPDFMLVKKRIHC